jgi:N-hydroxyarylamine O-acetyltransferase
VKNSIEMKKENDYPVTIEDKLQSGVSSTFDLDAYFRRIGYTGERTPTLSTLRAIHALHPQAIPFENLNPLLRRPVNLDIASIQQKLVQGGRGGYCFEHNLLLKHALEALGFNVKGLAARVVWNMPEDVITPRGHMLLLVEVNSRPFIADVGFGGSTLTAPLLLEPNTVQETPHEPFRLIKEGVIYTLQINIKDTWKSLYRFDLQEQFLPDYEVSSWYLSTHPNSHFMTSLKVGRVTPDRRYALANNEFAIHYLHGNTERHTLASVSALRSTLENIFGLNLNGMQELDAVLQRLTQMVDEPSR